MKSLYPFKILLALLGSISMTFSGNAQATLEFAAGTGPTGGGSSISSQTITFQNNTDNPSGNTFIGYATPVTTVTFALSNQQYSVAAAVIPARAPLVFGGTINAHTQTIATFPFYNLMNVLGAPSNNDFTSAGSPQAPGTGISTADDYSLEMFNSAMGLYAAGAPTNGRYYIADLTITFNTPITNPVLHLAGLGAIASAGSSTLGMTTEFDLKTSGVVLSELSGSTELKVTGTSILNSATHPASTTGSGAASGSILVTGSSITSLVFKVYLRGDGGMANWSTAAQHTGDGFLIGVSSVLTDIFLPVSLFNFSAVAQTNHTTQLQWIAASEDNIDFFGIEYSTDQTAWQSIGAVQATGDSGNRQSYGFIHTRPVSGSNYYRLKQVDKDGNYTYSSLCTVFFGNTPQFNFYPNPVVDRVVITGSQPSLGSVKVMTADGRALQQINNLLSGGNVDLSRYPSGIYLLAIRDISGTTTVWKVLKK